VILPCAGAGSRLGLPFPKELAPLGPGRVLIDSCLDLIRETSLDVRILLLDGGAREQTAACIGRRLPDVPLARVRQDPDARDLPDAVRCLEPWLGSITIVLLPDVLYSCTGDVLAQIGDRLLEDSFCFAAAVKPEEELGALGALRTRDDHVVAYEDKPDVPGLYDSAWGMLGFSGTDGLAGLDLVTASTLRQVRGPVTALQGTPVVWIDGFRDCGTWDSYESARRHRARTEGTCA
jgi:hypothetical protein